MEFTIRRVVSDDDILALALLKTENDAEYCRRTPDQEHGLRVTLSSLRNKMEAWLAFVGEEPIGYVWGKRREDMYEGEGLYVQPGWRNQGIGTALKKAQLAHAQEQGCTRYSTVIELDNAAARRVHEKVGALMRPNDPRVRVILKEHKIT